MLFDLQWVNETSLGCSDKAVVKVRAGRLAVAVTTLAFSSFPSCIPRRGNSLPPPHQAGAWAAPSSAPAASRVYSRLCTPGMVVNLS